MFKKKRFARNEQSNDSAGTFSDLSFDEDNQV